MVSRDAFEALQQALKHDVTEPATSMAIVSEKEILEARYRKCYNRKFIITFIIFIYV